MGTKKPKPEWDKDRILALLDSNDRAVERALLAIYHRQTKDEREAKDTIEHNGVGFNAFDARTLTVNAEYLLKFGSLSPGRLSLVHDRIRKYASQLASMANSRS